jgi:ProP effector
MSTDVRFNLSLGKETWEKLRLLKENELEQNPTPSFKTNSAKSPEDEHLNEEPPHNSKKGWLEKRDEYRAVINWLCQTFPSAFNFAKPLPLKLNITKDLYEHLPTDASISKVRLRAAIQYYTHSTSYLNSLIKATHRINLEGQEVEPILDSHKEFTQSILARRQEKKKALKPKGFSKNLSSRNLQQSKEAKIKGN